MQLKVIDAVGVQQTVIAQALESVVDHSGLLYGGASLALMDANPLRSGFVFQNLSIRPMYVNDKGPASAAPGSFLVGPGEIFPPYGYPVPTGSINVIGTSGDGFTAREW